MFKILLLFSMSFAPFFVFATNVPDDFKNGTYRFYGVETLETKEWECAVSLNWQNVGIKENQGKTKSNSGRTCPNSEYNQANNHCD